MNNKIKTATTTTTTNSSGKNVQKYQCKINRKANNKNEKKKANEKHFYLLLLFVGKKEFMNENFCEQQRAFSQTQQAIQSSQNSQKAS